MFTRHGPSVAQDDVHAAHVWRGQGEGMANDNYVCVWEAHRGGGAQRLPLARAEKVAWRGDMIAGQEVNPAPAFRVPGALPVGRATWARTRLLGHDATTCPCSQCRGTGAAATGG